MIYSNDFRNGITLELDGDLFAIVDFQHVKPGKGSAFVRTKLKNVKTGYVVEKTFRAGEKVNRAIMEHLDMQFLYAADDLYHFMDERSYEQVALTAELLGDRIKWLKDGMTVKVATHDGIPIDVELPTSVELEVVETEPGFKGDTATGGNKPARLETGAIAQVPLFVNVGDRLLIDTRSGQYLKRA